MCDDGGVWKRLLRLAKQEYIMARNPKAKRTRRYNYTVSCFMPKGKESIWFPTKDGGLQSWKYAKTRKRANVIVDSLFKRGAEEVHVNELKRRIIRTYSASQKDRASW